jgi:hypothetical protein
VLLHVFLGYAISYIHAAIVASVSGQGEEGEVLSRLKVFNSVEVLAPGIEVDDLDSLLNSGESDSSSSAICVNCVSLQMYAH